jgi:1-acyl-sn-glycerol-3-phosphate acyltransferase
MPDARVIAIEGERRDRRPPAGARSVLAGADRASGERARRRRRTTPLLAERESAATSAPGPDEEPDPGGNATGTAGRGSARRPARKDAATQNPADNGTANSTQRAGKAPAKTAKTAAAATPRKRSAAKSSPVESSPVERSAAESESVKSSAESSVVVKTAQNETSGAEPGRKESPSKPAAGAKKAARSTSKGSKRTAATASPGPAKATAKAPPAKTTPAKTTPSKATPSKATPSKATPAKTAPAKTATTTKSAVAKPAAGKPAAGKPATAKSAAGKPAAGKPATAKSAARKTTVATSTGKRAAGKPAAARSGAAGGTTARDGVILPERGAPPAWVAEAARKSAQTGGAAPVDGGRLALAAGIASQVGEMLLDVVGAGRRVAAAEERVGKLLEFLGRRLTGEYEVDEFGFDPELTETVLLSLIRPLYRKWFRVDVRGIENIPAEGGALVVANHSGTVALDSVMTGVAVHDETPGHRYLRMLGADLVFQTPFLAGIARKGGATLASNPDAERLLREGNLVGVWPEGFKGVGKPFSERYKLQRFGRGGFVSAALRTGTPIIPCSIVGAEEIYPIIADAPPVARLLGLPYLPVTPFFPWFGPLGAIPLPSKWLIEFGTPVPTHEFGPGAADDPMLVFDLTDRVRQTIQQTLYSLLVQRRSIFF